MATDRDSRRYRALYELLVQLYPRPFRDRFGKGMEQTVRDQCRERRTTNQGLFGFAIWVFLETSLGIAMESTTQMTPLRKTILRVALVALGLLMAPLVASRVVDGWNWPPRAFVLTYALFFATGLAYALIARRVGSWAYKAGVGLALVTGFVMGWSNMVQTSESDNPANLLYFGVLALGAIGACIARLEARGLARTLFVMAAALAVLAVILSPYAPLGLERRVAIGHGVFVAMFACSGLMFRHASLARLGTGNQQLG